MRSGVDVSVERTPAGSRIALAGELNIYAVAALKQRLLSEIEDAAEAEIDLSGVSELDSAGLQLLILAKLHARRIGQEVRLVQHSPEVVDLIELYNLAAFFGDPLVISRQEPPRPRHQDARAEHAP